MKKFLEKIKKVQNVFVGIFQFIYRILLYLNRFRFLKNLANIGLNKYRKHYELCYDVYLENIQDA